jgi:dihydrofolate reductase
MTIALIVAVAENGVIGRGNTLPWHLPDDLRQFKALTLDHALIMGRKTWVAIGRPLPRRHCIVLSRQPGLVLPGAQVAATVAQALALAAPHGDPVFVAGGAEIFALFLPLAHRLHLTRVHAAVPGDATFPPWDPAAWQLVASQPHAADATHAYAFTCETWERG